MRQVMKRAGVECPGAFQTALLTLNECRDTSASQESL
jgi:hypothetical protein